MLSSCYSNKFDRVFINQFIIKTKDIIYRPVQFDKNVLKYLQLLEILLIDLTDITIDVCSHFYVLMSHDTAVFVSIDPSPNNYKILFNNNFMDRSIRLYIVLKNSCTESLIEKNKK